MPSITEDLRSEVNSFFASVADTALDEALGIDIPLIGSPVQDALDGAVPFFADIKGAILGVLDDVEDATSATAIANALDALDDVTATAANGKVLIHIGTSDSFSPMAEAFDLDVGSSALGVKLNGSVGYALNAGLDVNLIYDAATSHALTIDDKGDPELSLGINGSLDLNGKGDLGFLDLTATDKLATPEITLTAAINIADGKDVSTLSAADFTTTISGDANLDLGLSAGLLQDETSLIPTILTDLIVKDHVDSFDPSTGLGGLGATPTIELSDIRLDLGSFVDWLSDVFGPLINDVFGKFPLGDLLDAVTTPLPVIDDGLRALKLTNLFDLVGDDKMINLLDLAAAGGADKAVLNAFATAFNFIKGLNDATGAGETDTVKLGSLTLLGDAPTMGLTAFDASDPIFTAADDPITAAQNALDDTLGNTPKTPGLGGLLQPLVDALTTIGLKVPLLSDPEHTIVPLLLNSSSAPVTLIEYNVPALTYNAGFEQFFPILGPIGVFLGGDFATKLDVDFGYDTRGIADGTFTDGFYFTTAPLLTPKDLGDGEIAYYEAAGTVNAGVHASAGINVGIASVQVGGGLDASLEAYFPTTTVDNKLYLSTIGTGCLFDPIHGEFGVDIFVKAKIGVGFFSVTRKFDIADIILAEFNFGCHGNATDAGFGLATLGPDGGVTAGVLAINAGTRANDRSIQGKHGTDGSELFQVRNAYDDKGIAIAGALDVSAFGINEHYGSAGNSPTLISAQMGNERDEIVIAADVTQNAHLEGNGGDDLVVGGAGNDELFGDDGEDHLIGGAGDDHLYGGDNDDVLEGGLGADIIDGGSGTDQVTYENSAQGVTFTYASVDGRNGFIGSGGEATGDVLYDVEYLIGSHFDDVLHGNPGQSNTIEGLAGNDVIFGGSQDDLLLGGAGADTIYGGADTSADGNGTDTTSYTTSPGLVYVDLNTGTGYFSDAAGDHLVGIENVQGSFAGDVLIGNAADNVLDGWFGDDTLEGGGGHDKIYAGAGSDTVYGDADGDELDGDGSLDEVNNGAGSQSTPGRDLLSYALVTGRGVTINLHDGNGDDNTIHYTLPDGSVFNSFEDLTGSNQSDNLTGDDQYNVIRGLSGDDVINGLGGNDVIVGGAGGDTIDGGAGRDLADYRSSPGAVYVNLQAGFGIFNDASGDTLTSVEKLRGSDYADTLIGDANVALFVDGNNEIDPGLSHGGTDHVDGGGTDGNDTDTLVLDYSRGDVGLGVTGGFEYIGASNGSFQRLANDGTTLLDGVTFTNIEQLRVTGTAEADTIQGGYGNDTISTGGGDDNIDAASGVDVVLAGKGNDFVDHFTGIDSTVYYLDGGSGIDTLSVVTGYNFGGLRNGGYQGNLTITGGDGTTEFSGTNFVLPDSGAAAVNFEILRDVTTGGGDDIVTQLGRFDNVIGTGNGSDVITPGLGVDTINGGSDFTNDQIASGRSAYGYIPITSLQEASAILLAPGDKLVLDYSSSTDQVIGSTNIYNTLYSIDGDTFGAGYGSILQVLSNQGEYHSGDDIDSFQNIEQLSVIGSANNDYIVGTSLAFGFNVTINDRNGAHSGSDSLRGDDYLAGGAGDDVLIGLSGDDTLVGGAGDDVLAGSNDINANRFVIPDLGEIDHLSGGAGADTFILGSALGPLYGDATAGYGGFNARFASDDNRAIITDFDKSQDRLALWNDGEHHGSSLYCTEERDGSTFIYYRDGLAGGIAVVPAPANDELIAELVGVTGVDLDAAYVDYRTDFSDLLQVPSPTETLVVPAALAVSDSAATDVSALGADIVPLAAPWVTQTADPDALKSALFGGGFSPLGQGTLTIEGNSVGFGTFSGDPFGLGSGIVLSTGDVSDLAGPNLVDGGLAKAKTANLTFEVVGNFNGSTVYRADLSTLGFDINSLKLGDTNSGFGGSPGSASGFDIDGIILSNTLITSTTGLDLNSVTDLPRLDVLNFNATTVQFDPGTQLPSTGSGFANAADLQGEVNGLPNFSYTTFDQIDYGSTGRGYLSLGNGGSLGVDLTSTLDTSKPVYLYVAEAGANGEQLAGGFSASSNRLDAPTDLSTDLGLPGGDDDTVTLTYTFTPTNMGGMTDGTVTDISLDFVFFSEELMEFAQSQFNDDFKIMLNGVNLARLSDGSFASVNTLATPAAGADASTDIFSLRTDQGLSDLNYNPVGTGSAASETRADAYSNVLHFTGPIKVGQVNVLTIEARDVRDGLLDSGILIKGGSLTAETLATFAIDRNDTPLDEGQSRSVGYHVVLPAGASASSPVTITLDPTDGLDLGAGAGVAVTKTVATGGPYDGTFNIAALPDGKSDGERTEMVDVTVSGAGITDGVAPLNVIVDDVFQTISRTIGDAPMQYSRLAPNAWHHAWIAAGITITHTADHEVATPIWSAVDFGTLNPGILIGSDMLAGDLGVSGIAGTGTDRPQDITGPEALRFVFDSNNVTDFEIAFARFTSGDSALIQLYDSAGTLIRSETATTASYDLAGLHDVASAVISAASGGFMVDSVTVSEAEETMSLATKAIRTSSIEPLPEVLDHPMHLRGEHMMHNTMAFA